MNIQPGTSNARQSAEIGRKAQPRARKLSAVPSAKAMENMEISVAEDGAGMSIVIRVGNKVYKSGLTEV